MRIQVQTIHGLIRITPSRISESKGQTMYEPKSNNKIHEDEKQLFK